MKYIFPFGCYIIGGTMLSTILKLNNVTESVEFLIGLGLFVYGIVSAYHKMEKKEKE